MTKVLIVDDSRVSREAFERTLSADPGYLVVAAIENAANAEIACMSNQIDLILMDVCTADDESGIRAAGKIKKNYPNTKVIVMTSMPEYSFIQKAKDSGSDSFWYKEIEEQPLLNVMDRTMAGEQVYPDSPPSVKLGLADSSEFTDRELEVLRILTTGCPDQEIAARLNISFSTVRTHINHMLDKTGFETRTELAIHARLSGIVIPDI